MLPHTQGDIAGLASHLLVEQEILAMSAREIATITFTDADSGLEGVVIVRVARTAVGIALSLREDGDVEVFLPVNEARTLAAALQSAIAETSTGM